MSGLCYGRWTVLAKAGNTKGGSALWLARCACGTEKTVMGADLRNGKSVSCGCEGSRATIGARRTTHGQSSSRLYNIWQNMHARCSRPTEKNYFGKGIAVCAEWSTFEPFQSWALPNGYADNLTIERTDNDKGYNAGNCIWATMKVQARNRSIVHRTPEGRAWAEVAEEYGVPTRVFNNRMAAGGWPPEVAATWPLGKRRATRDRTALGQWAPGESTWRR